MYFNSKTTLFLAFFLISSITGNALARDFILKNNSRFDIFYRCRSNEEAAIGKNFDCANDVLKSGESVTLDMNRNYSIKTAGTSPLMPYSSFYDVPIKELLKDSASNNPTEHSILISNSIPVFVVTSGLTYGWNFNLEWQRNQ